MLSAHDFRVIDVIGVMTIAHISQLLKCCYTRYYLRSLSNYYCDIARETAIINDRATVCDVNSDAIISTIVSLISVAAPHHLAPIPAIIITGCAFFLFPSSFFNTLAECEAINRAGYRCG